MKSPTWEHGALKSPLLDVLRFAMLLGRAVAVVLFAASAARGTELISVPPAGKLYQGLYFDEPAAGRDPTEHDVTAENVAQLEQALGTKTAWVYFSDNWFESRKFPRTACDWIRGLGKVPYVRLMLRSDAEQDRPETLFTLANILAGKFDDDLKTWARDAKQFGSPVLVEWGTEPNGKWFSWNGKWNGGAKEGPAGYVAAYRHIVDLMRGEGAGNLHWVWHVNWLDQPEAKWNQFENYYPGEDYCDWVALSAYGPLTPRAVDGTESLRFKMSTAYPQLTKLAPGKPIVIAEFGCDIHHSRVDAGTWAREALEDLFSGRWPAVIGFCWWNETWANDDVRKHDTDMNILHHAGLTKVFREELVKHADKLQATPIIKSSSITTNAIAQPSPHSHIPAWSISASNTPATCIATRFTGRRTRKSRPTRRRITKEKAKRSLPPISSPLPSELA